MTSKIALVSMFGKDPLTVISSHVALKAVACNVFSVAAPASFFFSFNLPRFFLIYQISSPAWSSLNF